MKYDDDFEAPIEHFSKRKDRRKPKGKRSVNELQAKRTPTGRSKFDEPGLQHLFERGYLSKILGELKSGKEATVYLAQGPEGLLAAKIYRDRAVRSFKNDHIYREGRYIGDDRIEKAIVQRSHTGIGAQQALWIMHEYNQLWAFQQADIPCPHPRVGPGLQDIAAAGRVVLMDLIGDEEGPAPRLSDIRLDAAQAKCAWHQSLDILAAILALGKVHGDYSTYNLMWWQNTVFVIDVPQTVDMAENLHAWHLFERDVASLCTTFKRHGIREDPGRVARELKGRQKNRS